MAHFTDYPETLILRVRTCAVIVLFGNLPANTQDYRSHHDKGTRGTAIAKSVCKARNCLTIAMPRISAKQYLWRSLCTQKILISVGQFVLWGTPPIPRSYMVASRPNLCRCSAIA
ncbi:MULTISPECIES: hypothetical protein [Pseudanabaena]|uniref:hypothetical protein n=1 Tax=Pseudanabaena TaxID=1152 RepID=UPI002479B7CE|nr:MULTISPECIES: hypothetical protein [Pseudanabaena]MEA5489277.1 hypothetical protein [Pseudanabaena sp. CCNP1317]WGS74075.1 hypothetical protein OA858_08620 [Pseudanabaena galeata CCNP1313]